MVEGGTLIASMTGFGKASRQSDTLLLEVEVKSVNSRFLDLSFKLPRSYSQFEIALRELVSSRLARGRVELVVRRQPVAEQACAVEFNQALFKAYWGVCQEVTRECGVTDDATRAAILRDLLNRSDVLAAVEQVADEAGEKEQLLWVVGAALDAVVDMRRAEGAQIEVDLLHRLARLREIEQALREIAAQQGGELKTRLQERLAQLAPEVIVDEQRVAAEVVFWVDRLDVTEELVRLKSHFEQFTASLHTPPSGRKLEFLLQELGREFNTIGSKIQDAAGQHLVVAAKAELEKLKEQISNVE